MEVTLSPRARVIVAWIAVIFGGFVLFEAAHALKPFVWAVITAYLFHPLVAFIHRKTHLPKQLITAWLYALLGLLFTILLINLIPPLVSQIQELQQERIGQIVDDIEAWLEQRPNGRFMGIDNEFIEQRLAALGDQVGELLSTEAVPLLLSTFTVAIELIIYLIASFYLIVSGDRFVQSLRSFLNRRYHSEFDRLLTDINTTLGRYLRGQVVLVVIMSVASYIALRILDVDYALSVAIATGFLELIPLVGPWAAGAIAVTIALFQETAPFGWSNGTLAIVVAFTYFALRQLEDAFVIPLVIGRLVHLHPLLVILVLVIGTSLGGPLGLILAVPFAAVMKIVVGYFYGKLIARETRQVHTIRNRADLEQLRIDFPEMVNATIVLLIEPDSLDWNDLDVMQEVAEEALDHAIDLSVVTTDGIAGALATAAGIATATMPSAVPIGIEPARP